MTSRIIIDQNASNTAKMMAQAVNGIIEAVAFAKRTKGVIDSTVSGNPADNAALAAAGVGANAQEAGDAWTIFSTAYDAISVPAVAELARLDQG
jgi:hypothetical protein